MSPNDADGMANSVDPDQTAPLGAVWSGSALFAQAFLSENLGSLWYLLKLAASDTAISYGTSWRWRFFAYHHAMKHPHKNIILLLFSNPFVLNCAVKSVYKYV